jgi:hypothetical protein
LDERRVNFQPHHYEAPESQPNNHKPPTRITERWFIGDHSDIGGRFAFESLNKEALANPPFRWIVWAAACAAGSARKSYLLFNDRAFVKYFPTLLYQGKTPKYDFDLRNHPDNFLTTDYLFLHPPSDDSLAASHADTYNRRPQREVHNTKLEVHDSFTPLSIWRTTQAVHGKGLHGNRRNLDNAILHASVIGKLVEEPGYGGNNRMKLEKLRDDSKSDEGVWGRFGQRSITFRT